MASYSDKCRPRGLRALRLVAIAATAPLMVISLMAARTAPTALRPVSHIKRTFTITADGQQVVDWNLIQKQVLGPCTVTNQGKGTETLRFISKPENFKFNVISGVGDFPPGAFKKPSVTTTQRRVARLTLTGKGSFCPPPSSAPTTDCNKLVDGTAVGLEPAYLSARLSGRKVPGIGLDLPIIFNAYSLGKQFRCPFFFSITGSPIELLAKESEGGRVFYYLFAKATISKLLALKVEQGLTLSGKATLEKDTFCATQAPPGITCSFSGTITWKMTITRE